MADQRIDPPFYGDVKDYTTRCEFNAQLLFQRNAPFMRYERRRRWEENKGREELVSRSVGHTGNESSRRERGEENRRGRWRRWEEKQRERQRT